MWWLTSQKNGASALGLQRVLGLGSYKTAWTWLHKLRRAMVRPGRDRLSGRVEVDETYLGGLEEGVRGRQTDAKALIVVAAEEDGAGIGRVRIRTIPNASGDSLMAFVGESIEPGSVVHTDGWLGYEPLEGDGYRHEVSYLEGQPARVETAPPGAPRGVVSEALDTGHASRSGQSRASRLLPRRIRLPLQPPQVQKSRQALLPPGSTGRRRATGTLQIAGRRHRDTRYGRPQHVGAISQYLSQVNTHLRSLLSTEKAIIQSAYDAGGKMAKFRADRSTKPSEAVKALAQFGSKLTQAFNENMDDIYSRGALRPLGTLLFIEAARALAAGASAENGKPSAMFSLSVLKEDAEFNLPDFAKNQLPPEEDVLLRERLVSLT